MYKKEQTWMKQGLFLVERGGSKTSALQAHAQAAQPQSEVLQTASTINILYPLTSQ
jgi:hypothetical protein